MFLDLRYRFGIRLNFIFVPDPFLFFRSQFLFDALSKRIAERKGTLKLCSIASSLSVMFIITRLNTIFDLYDTEELALESFNQ